MKKVVSYGVLVLLALAIVATCTAGAQLVGTSFGFPTILQTGQTTVFNQDIATAFDNEAVNIGFPSTAAATGCGGIGMAFPTISQTVSQGQTLQHTDFAQTCETASFAYPFVGVGSGIAGFGMGGFGSALGIC